MKRLSRILPVLSLFLLAVFFQSAQSAEPVTLEVWNVFDPATNVDGRSMTEKFREYEKLNPGVTIKHNVMVYADLKQKAVIAGQAQQGPDHLHMLGEWVPEFSRMGIIEDITSQAKAWSDYNKFPQTTWNVSTVNDRIFGLPSIASTRVLLYREDLLKKAGFPKVPTNWQELREAAKKIAADVGPDGKPKVYGFAFCSASTAIRGPQEFAVHLWSTGADLVKRSGDRWVPGFTPEQAAEVFQFYYDLMFVDKSAPPFSIGWEYQELDSAFQAGTIAMAQNGAWMKRRADESESGKAWKTAYYPYAKVPATYLEVKIEGISKFSKHKKETWEFMKWLYNRDNDVYISQTGNLPSRLDAKESRYWVADKVWRDTFLESAAFGHPMPPIPTTPILKGSMESLQEVLYKRMSPQDAGKDYFNKVKTYLDTSVNK
jgi:multiple sugar transport system substrate-binding protein